MHLQSNGANVEVSDDPDRAAYRASLGIPDDAVSCHTAIVDGYAIEGHVPATAIQRLLASRPDAVGLALPGMPADSPAWAVTSRPGRANLWSPSAGTAH